MAVHRAGARGSIRTPRRHVSLRAGRLATPGPPATAGRPAMPLLWTGYRCTRPVIGPAELTAWWEGPPGSFGGSGYFSVLPASTVMGSPVT